MVNSIKSFSSLMLAVFILILASCSGFFDNGKNIDNSAGLSPLALADGSGYLSSEDHNEITPFLYHDTNATDKTWLFFSSDRTGDYDIYCAEMDAHGNFLNLMKINTLVNTSNQEYSPVVSDQFDQNSILYLCLSFIRVSNSTLTQIITMCITNTANMSGYIMSVINTNSNATRLGLRSDGYNNYLEISTGADNFFYEYGWDTSSCAWSYFSSYSTLPIIFPVYNVHGFYYMNSYNIGSNYYESFGTFHIMDCVISGLHQIYYSLDWYMPYIQTFGPIIPYESSFNDIDPVIDIETGKVYFASDRYGNNNFDLYRYNLLTYDKVTQIPTPIFYPASY